jgi:hypothetical protein
VTVVLALGVLVTVMLTLRVLVTVVMRLDVVVLGLWCVLLRRLIAILRHFLPP